MTTATLKKRLGFKLFGNVASLALGVIIMAVVPKALGPSDFGRFEFITANFNLILGTFTLQVPVAYFNWVSRKGHKENTDYASGLTFYLSASVMILFGLFIQLSIWLGINDRFWPDIKPEYLWQALLYSSALYLYQLCIYLSDGRALTVGLEKLRLIQNIVKTIVIIILFVTGLLTLHSYFSVQSGIACIAFAASTFWLASHDACSSRLLFFWRFDSQEKEAFHSFLITFVRPLMLSTIVAFIILYFDRWFLQIIGGSAQQGYFSLSDKLGAIAIIFTSAMTPLLSREFAHSYEEHDKARMARLFDRIKVFLFIASVLGCFMSVQSSAIVELIGGEKYQNAVVPIAIMALYPIHQTFGQLSAALLLATGQTGLYAKIAVLVMLLSVPMSYFFMAPSNYLLPGLALGATGLAIKMLLLQFVGTNIQLYFNTRFLGVSFRKWMIHQLKTVGIIYALALLSRFVAAKIANDYFSAWNVFNIDSHAFTASLHLGFSGIFFIVIVFSVFITAPSLAGIKRDELVTFYCDCFNKLQIKKGL